MQVLVGSSMAHTSTIVFLEISIAQEENIGNLENVVVQWGEWCTCLSNG